MAESKMPLREQFERMWKKHTEAGEIGVPPPVLELLSSAFAKIPVSSFPSVPSGKVIEVSADASIAQAVSTLSKHNIFSAPVRDSTGEGAPDADRASRYIGMIDYGAVILWVLEQAELAAAAIAAGSATMAGVGAGALGALGAVVLGLTGPAAVAGLATAAVGAAVAGGLAAERGTGRDASTAADALGDEFYHVILREEPFKSTTVSQLIESYRWAPFFPVRIKDSMMTVLLLMSRHRIRSVPVVEPEKPEILNLITQSAVVRGLCQCQGRDWFDTIAERPLHDLALPRMAPDQVVFVESDRLVLEAFKLMRDKAVGGLPVVDPQSQEIVGSISVRDIRFLLLKPELFARRQDLTVLDFMEIVTSAPIESNRPLLTPPVVTEEDATLGEIIRTVSEKRIHRIYVVDSARRVTGVISVRDIISCFVSEESNQEECIPVHLHPAPE